MTKIFSFLFLALLFGYLAFMLFNLKRKPPFSLLNDTYGTARKQLQQIAVTNQPSKSGYLYLRYDGETYSATVWKYTVANEHLLMTPNWIFKSVFDGLAVPLNHISLGGRSFAFGFIPTHEVFLKDIAGITLMVPGRIANLLAAVGTREN